LKKQILANKHKVTNEQNEPPPPPPHPAIIHRALIQDLPILGLPQ
jgi:hypothetical protein